MLSVPITYRCRRAWSMEQFQPTSRIVLRLRALALRSQLWLISGHHDSMICAKKDLRDDLNVLRGA